MGLKVIWLGAAVEASLIGKMLAATGTHFSNTITLGTVVVGMLVVIVAGVFTIRANTAKIWRQNYEGEKERADNLASDLVRITTEKDAEIAHQRELKHAALGENAALKKTDQTAVLTLLKELDQQRSVSSVQIVESITGLANTTADVSRAVAAVVRTTEGLVSSVEKLNRRLDAIEGNRPGGSASPVPAL